MVSWGAWEYSGGNGMRVGIDVNWEAVSHTENAATATVKIYTENQFTYGDTQTLSYSGAIGGSTSFSNNDGGTPPLRATKTYTYTYGPAEYGSSPGSRTFTARLSGAYNGVTPSKSLSSNIPARPIGGPLDPTNVSAARISDTSHKVSWTNRDTNANPWSSVRVDRLVDNGTWDRATNAGGSASTYTDNSTEANRRYRWRVSSDNSVGTSDWVYTGTLYTTPAAPTDALRSTSGANQVITWTNNASSGYLTEVWHAANGTWDSTPLATVAAGTATYTHTSPSSSIAHSYRVRAVIDPTVQDNPLPSAYSNTTTATIGTTVTSPPNAPTNLSPSGGAAVSIGSATVFTWTHNPTDGSAQTAYDFQWRYAGDVSWHASGKTLSSTSSTTVAVNTFSPDSTIEWQVRTYGSNPTPGPYAPPVIITTSASTNRSNLRPVVLNTLTGRLEAQPPGLAIIPEMLPTAGPAEYPLGYTTFYTTTATGWPSTEMTVETVNFATTSTLQRATSRLTGITWQRTATDSSGAWSSWVLQTADRRTGSFTTSTYTVNTVQTTNVSFSTPFPTGTVPRVFLMVQNSNTPQAYSYGINSTSNTGFVAVSVRNTGTTSLTFGYTATTDI